MKLAAVYLARSEDGSARGFLDFARSYKRFPAGVDHDLLIILKGEARRQGTRTAVSLLFEGIPHRLIEIPDDGFDIHAYLHAARTTDYDYMCFLNTYSSLCAGDWFAKLLTPLLEDPTCGMTGASASYESLYETHRLIHKATWLAAKGKIPFDSHLAASMFEEFKHGAPEWLNACGQTEDPTDSTQILDPSLEAECHQHWRDMTKTGGILNGVIRFKPFPNPHLRTNAWVIRRSVLNSLDVSVGPTKADCADFESGQTGIPTLLAQQGLRQILVGANGDAYEVERWPQSRTFKLENQQNILVRDNQVDAYQLADPFRRAYLSMAAWGEYLASTPHFIKKLGFGFDRGNLKLAHATFKPGAKDRQVRISVIVPCFNDSVDLQETLKSITCQNYPFWECVVFDNCAGASPGEWIDQLGDERIKVARSSEPLPTIDCWNEAIDQATGDYVVLIEQGGALAPLFMNTIAYVAAQHRRPNFIHSGFFRFFRPGASPSEPAGYVEDVRNLDLFNHEKDIFKLDIDRALDVVRDSLMLRRGDDFRMQTFCFERGFLDSIRMDGKVFHSRLPGLYLACVAFGLATTITIAPKPITIIGIPPDACGSAVIDTAATGYTVTESISREVAGLPRFIASAILPGRALLTDQLVTMSVVQDRLGQFAPSEISIERYRRMQILHGLNYPTETMKRPPLDDELQSLLSAEEIEWAQSVEDLAERSKSDAEARMKLEEIYADLKIAKHGGLRSIVDIGSYSELGTLFAALDAEEVQPMVY